MTTTPSAVDRALLLIQAGSFAPWQLWEAGIILSSIYPWRNEDLEKSEETLRTERALQLK